MSTFLCVLCSGILWIACFVFVITYCPSLIPSLLSSLHYSFNNLPFPFLSHFLFHSLIPFFPFPFFLFSLPPPLSFFIYQSLTHIIYPSPVISIRSNKSAGHSNSTQTVFGVFYPLPFLKISNLN